MSTFGITKVQGQLIESVDVEHKGDTKQLINYQGGHEAARNVDDSFTFSVKGKGDLSVSVGAISSGIPTGVSGAAFVTKTTVSQVNEDWQSFSYDGVAYPHVT
jgi:hypothetical protein